MASIEELHFSDRKQQQQSRSPGSKTYTTAARKCKKGSANRWMVYDDDSDNESTGPQTPREQTFRADKEQSDDDRRMMDDLLDRLRNGKSLHRSRRQRWARRRQLNIETSIACLHSSRSSSTTCLSSACSSHDGFSLGGDGLADKAPLSAEDLLYSLQNEAD